MEWLELAGGLGLSRARTSNYDRVLVNSPKALGYFRGAVPLGTSKVWLAGSYRYVSTRKTLASEVAAASVVDLTISTRRLHPAFDIVAGVKNAFDRAYWDPAGDRHIIDAYPRRGRTAFVKLAWQYGE
jgi:outer membrane receptor protein involved in Fe transport